jgi:phage terminase Nu1 subunit (DNA packaging protein)
MIANRQQTCSIFGLTRAEFDRLLLLGFPAQKKSSSRGEDWTVDTVEAHKWLLNVALAEAGLVAAGEGALDGEQQRARRDKAAADKGELEVRRMRGELVDAAAIERALSVLDVALKDRLLTVPMAAAPEAVDAAREGGPPAAANVIARYLHAALADFAGAEVVGRVARKAA